MEEHFFLDKNVLFVLFNGESYDYIGSQRLVYDIENDSFPTRSDPKSDSYIPPIKLSDISLLIELNQLSQSKHIHAFMQEDKDEIKNFLANLKYNKQNFVIDEFTNVFPPSSIQSFIRVNNSIPAIVITDHGLSYTNQYYNSLFDNVANVNYTYYPINQTNNIPLDSIQYHIANISNVLARTIHHELNNKEYEGDAVADVVIVSLIKI